MSSIALDVSIGAAQLHLGARVSVRLGGQELEWTGKAAVVLAMLALDERVDRQQLALLLWPDSPAAQARNNLRTLVHRMQQRAGWPLLGGAEHLLLDDRLVRRSMHDVDVVLSALATGGAARCELLAEAGVASEEGEALRSWLQDARQRLRRIQLSALCEALAEALGRADVLGAADVAPRDTQRAVALARACVQLEPLSEHWHRQLMDTLVRCGDRAAALAAYEACKAQLREQLGVMPDVQTRAMHLRILQSQAQAEAAGDADPADAEAQAGAAPQQQAPEANALSPLGGAARYPLVEREYALAEARQALAAGRHLVLHGEAGVGKTRLLRHLVAGQPGVEQVVIRAGQRGTPHSALAQLLQELQPRCAPQVGVSDRIELARLAPQVFPGVQASQAPVSVTYLQQVLTRWMAALGRVGVQWLVIDDVHEADTESQAMLAVLLADPLRNQAPQGPADDSPPDGASRPTPSSPRLVLAHRSSEIGPVLADGVLSACVRRSAHELAVPRLSLAGVQALLRSMGLGQAEATPQAHTLAQRMLQRTGGNALFVIELAQAARLQDGPDPEEAALTQAPSLEALLRQSVQACSQAAQQLATVAAVAGDDFSVELASALTGQSVLALMAPWAQLQQRGLFTEDGPAHDLVRSALLQAAPLSIRRVLHRQVAQYLEAAGQQGASVLQHWLAAEDFDHALPHAVHRMRALCIAGLDTLASEREVLGLLQRVGDAVLLANLWTTIETFQHREVWSQPGDMAQLQAIVQRVQGLPAAADTPAWLAVMDHELMVVNGLKTYQALAALDPWQLEPAAAAWAGLCRALCGRLVGADGFRADFDRALRIVSGLPPTPATVRLRRFAERSRPLLSGAVTALKDVGSRIRAARRSRDLQAIQTERQQRCFMLCAIGRYRSAIGQLVLVENGVLAADPAADRGRAVAALATGRYAHALALIEPLLGGPGDPEARWFGQVLYAVVAQRLGRDSAARAALAGIDTEQDVKGPQFHHLAALVRATLDARQGLDPLPGIRQALTSLIKSQGAGAMHVGPLSWLEAQYAGSPYERLALGAQILQGLPPGPSGGPYQAPMLLELAETHVEAGVPGAEALARQALRPLRRELSSRTMYQPEALLRCARLLRASDPAEAASLIHVARRWLQQALPHVPDDALESFRHHVPVNRLLLGDDEEAVYTATLR